VSNDAKHKLYVLADKWAFIARLEAQGFEPVGYVVDPDRLALYYQVAEVPALGKCWVKKL
jgi:hypothetical protein